MPGGGRLVDSYSNLELQVRLGEEDQEFQSVLEITASGKESLACYVDSARVSETTASMPCLYIAFIWCFRNFVV